jgi:hypothetical protein
MEQEEAFIPLRVQRDNPLPGQNGVPSEISKVLQFAQRYLLRSFEIVFNLIWSGACATHDVSRDSEEELAGYCMENHHRLTGLSIKNSQSKRTSPPRELSAMLSRFFEMRSPGHAMKRRPGRPLAVFWHKECGGAGLLCVRAASAHPGSMASCETMGRFSACNPRLALREGSRTCWRRQDASCGQKPPGCRSPGNVLAACSSYHCAISSSNRSLYIQQGLTAAAMGISPVVVRAPGEAAR